MPEPREKSKACPGPQLEREPLRAATTSVLSSSAEPRRGVLSSPLAIRATPGGPVAHEKLPSTEEPREPRACLPTGSGVRLQALDGRASNLSAAPNCSPGLRPQLRSLSCLQGCPSALLRRTPAICAPHLLPSLSTPLTAHASLRLSPRDSFPLWLGRLPSVLQTLPLPPSVRDSCCFFCSQHSSSVGPPHPLLSSRGLEGAGHSRRSGVAHTPGLAHQHISSQRIVWRWTGNPNPICGIVGGVLSFCLDC